MSADLLLDGLPFTRRIALDHGIGAQHLRDLLKAGEVCRVLNDVYVDARVTDDRDLRARCLRLVLPDGAALSRLTAAWLLGVDVVPLTRDLRSVPVECTVPSGREPLSRPGVRCYVAPLEDDVVLVSGLPCTSPGRTAVDLLRWLPPPDALAIVDAMAARGVVDAAGLPAVVERFAGTRGVVQARHLAAIVEPLTESPGESWLRLRLADAGFPRPEAQIAVPDADTPGHYRLDLGWSRWRVAVEYDGEEFHASPRQRERDERRRDDLRRRFGWTVLGVGKGDVLGRSMLLERIVGGYIGLEPRNSRRRW